MGRKQIILELYSFDFSKKVDLTSRKSSERTTVEKPSFAKGFIRIRNVDGRHRNASSGDKKCPYLRLSALSNERSSVTSSSLKPVLETKPVFVLHRTSGDRGSKGRREALTVRDVSNPGSSGNVYRHLLDVATSRVARFVYRYGKYRVFWVSLSIVLGVASSTVRGRGVANPVPPVGEGHGDPVPLVYCRLNPPAGP